MLEQEQEQLNASLMALTTHFGQVQFRLKQIVAAPVDDKESLLKELEEFAFRGCPNLDRTDFQLDTSSAHEQIIEEQRIKQKNLIDQLKTQLEDLETYAYQVETLPNHHIDAKLVLNLSVFVLSLEATVSHRRV
jgi:repressor of nif and glnA expression